MSAMDFIRNKSKGIYCINVQSLLNTWLANAAAPDQNVQWHRPSRRIEMIHLHPKTDTTLGFLKMQTCFISKTPDDAKVACI